MPWGKRYSELLPTIWLFDCKLLFIQTPNRYQTFIDENGDAAGNYTVLGLQKKHRDDDGILSVSYGLYPIGTFSIPDIKHIPVSFEDFIAVLG